LFVKQGAKVEKVENLKIVYSKSLIWVTPFKVTKGMINKKALADITNL